MGNLDFFNQLAAKTNTYLNTARFFSFDFQVYRRTFQDIKSKLDLQTSDRVLDLGGGCGQIAGYLASEVEAVVLADGAAEALAVAKKKLAARKNVSFLQIDINQTPLPWPENNFDKILCYAVIHYLNDLAGLRRLLMDLWRLVKPGGRILIGEIPLADKAEDYLARRRQKPIKHFLLNQKYYCKKYLTKFFYKLGGVDEKQVKGLRLTREIISGLVAELPNARFEFLAQDPGLPLANSREDLLIVKIT